MEQSHNYVVKKSLITWHTNLTISMQQHEHDNQWTRHHVKSASSTMTYGFLPTNKTCTINLKFLCLDVVLGELASWHLATCDADVPTILVLCLMPCLGHCHPDIIE